MPKVFTDTAYKKFIEDWNDKLTEVERKNAELLQVLQKKEQDHVAEIVKLKANAIDIEKITTEAKTSVEKAHEDARNSKERAKRFKKRIQALEQELVKIKQGL